MRSPVEGLQRGAFWMAIAAAIAGLATADDRSPVAGPVVCFLLHVAVLALGAVCGLATSLRSRSIDAHRWRVVADSALTRGEREWAHKEAESSKAKAGATLLAAPVLIAGWLSRLLPAHGNGLATDLLPATAMVGFGLVLAVLAIRYPSAPPAPM